MVPRLTIQECDLQLLADVGQSPLTPALMALGEGVAYDGRAKSGADQTTRLVIDHFNDAFNRHDADALAPLLTEDTVFEDTSPALDGRRIEGRAEVVEFWRGWFVRNADAVFEVEDMIVRSDRAVLRWVYRKSRNGQPGHLRDMAQRWSILEIDA